MRNSLKRRLLEHLYSILVISCTFGLVQKKYNLFTVLLWFFVNFARKVSLEIFDKSRPKLMNYNFLLYTTNKGQSPSNGKLSDFSFYIDSQKSAHRKFKK